MKCRPILCAGDPSAVSSHRARMASFSILVVRISYGKFPRFLRLLRLLHLLKTVIVKLQRSAVLGDGANDILGSTVGDVSFDFECDPDIRVHQSCEMLNDR